MSPKTKRFLVVLVLAALTALFLGVMVVGSHSTKKSQGQELREYLEERN